MIQAKKIFLCTTLLLTTMLPAFSETSLIKSDPYQLSTHILDIGRGAGAKEVAVQLFKQTNNNNTVNWEFISEDKTDANGRIKTFLPRQANKQQQGIYKLVFITEPYFVKNKETSFNPQVEVVFNISDDTHYHVPITLSNFGYSTYRGN